MISTTAATSMRAAPRFEKRGGAGLKNSAFPAALRYTSKACRGFVFPFFIMESKRRSLNPRSTVNTAERSSISPYFGVQEEKEAFLFGCGRSQALYLLRVS